MSPETELVLCLCRTPLTRQTRDRVQSILNSGMDWDIVFAQAGRWELEPAVFSNLCSIDAGTIPDDVRARAELVARESRAVAMSRSLFVCDLWTRFRSEGIEVIVVKGPSVAVLAYDDPSLRTFSDADFLLRERDIDRAVALLLAEGYGADYDQKNQQILLRGQHALEFSSGGKKVELHTALMSRHLRLDIDDANLWNSTREIDCLGTRIRVMSTPHLLIYLCAHGAKHAWYNPRWICDVAQIVDRLSAAEFDSAVALANRTHAMKIVLLALVLSRDLMKSDLSRLDLGRLGKEEKVKKLSAHVIGALIEPDVSAGSRSRRDPRLETLLFYTRSRERFIDKVATFATLAFVPSQRDAGSAPIRWVTHPFRIVAQALRQLAV